MLSDEEKKAIDELKEEMNKPIEVPEDKFNTFILYNIESGKTILNLIEKQSKEIEEAEQKEKKAYIDGTNVAHELCNKMWKAKIKAKIEEYNETLYYAETEQGMAELKDFEYDEAKYGKRILQSLLEKE